MQDNKYSLDFSRAYGLPDFSGLLKTQPEDFRVTEQLGFDLSGEGEHLFLFVEKRGLNTRQVATTLAQWAGIKPMDIGYAGMKDKVAVTRQWFSLYLGNRSDPDMAMLSEPWAEGAGISPTSAKIAAGYASGQSF